MIENTWTISLPAGFGMPVSVRDRIAVRDLPMTTGDVRPDACTVLADDHGFEGTTVSGYRRSFDVVATAQGLFPGTSAWSPPI